VQGGRIASAGTDEPKRAEILDAAGLVVLPALVNAHCHLDLSHLGSRSAPRADFVHWLEGVRDGRAAGATAIEASVDQGIALCRAGGSGAVGDIAGARSALPLARMRAAGLRGVSFVELIELRRSGGEAAAAVKEFAAGPEAARGSEQARLGISPHAPYTCPMEVFQAAAELDLPLATHLAESPEEIEFVRDGGGDIGRFFDRLGVSSRLTGGIGRHPIDLLAAVLRRRPWIAVHVNRAEEAHLRLLAEAGTSVVYCPRATEYFGHDRHGAHRYREMIGLGVNVALGTDGLPCLDTADRISVLDEMRLLYRRDRTVPELLLRMATTAGARALGLDTGLFTFRPGPIAGLIGVPFDPGDSRDPLEQILLRDDPPAWVAGPF
jgi:cytosine/adenosine deaminase-related metal-dependent hydrolase